MNVDLSGIGLEIFANVGVLSAITIAIVSICKSFISDSRIYPLVSLVVGVALAFLTLGISTVSTLSGIVIGLTASGLYDQKAIVVE